MAGVKVRPSFWAGRRVLVTGHTGFKGSWLCLWLASAGAEVAGFSDGIPTEPSLFELADVHTAVTSVFGDVADGAALDAAMRRHRPEVVLHLAAQPLVRRSYVDPTTTYRTNVLGTANVLEAARAVPGVGAVVIVTSDKCYEDQGQDRPYRETESLGGLDPYSSSKACAELITAAYRRSFLGPLGVGVSSARAGNVIGGGDWADDRLVPDLIRAALSGDKAQIRNPDAVRPWQHVLDCISGYLILAERMLDDPGAGGAWNFGPDPADARAVRWMADAIATRWGSGLEWVADGSTHPPESPVLRLDSSLARSRLAWQPAWTIEGALDQTVRWYQAYRDGEDVRALCLDQIAMFSPSEPGRP